MKQFNDPSKPGYTSLSSKDRQAKWMRFFNDDGPTLSIQKVLMVRDKKLIEKAAKKYNYRPINGGGYTTFQRTENT